MKRSLCALLLGVLLLSACDTHVSPPVSTACASVSDEWTLLGLRDDRIAEISAIAVDPVDPDVLLAATASNPSEGIPKEVYRSTDAGTTWTLVYRGLDELGPISQLVYDPFDPNVVYATPDVLFKSSDRGQTWRPSSSGVFISFDTRVQRVASDPAVPSRIYLVTTGPGGGAFYRSDDAGATWTEPSTGTCPTVTSGPYCDLRNGAASITVTATGRIYIGTNYTGSVLTSGDGGATWAYALDGEQGERGILTTLLADRTDGSTLYSGLEQSTEPAAFIETRDGGASWPRADAGLPVPLGAKTLVQNPLDGALLFSGGYRQTVGSVWRRGAGETAWEDIGPSTPAVVFWGLAVSPSRGLLYGGGFGVWSRPLPGATSTEAGPCD